MKIIAIGDTHGRTYWQDIVKNNEFDKIVFIGDYFDTHEDISAEQQINNFKNIIEYKNNNIDKVILLTGNHDFHYLKTIKESYSGYQELHAFDIQELLHNAIDNNLLQMCFIYDNILFSHAGITKTWCKNKLGNDNIDKNILEQSINDMFKFQPNAFKFTYGINFDMYGDDICQTPIWVRPKSLLKDKIDNYIQVVGHTMQEKLIINKDVIFIDTLGTSEEYLQIENDSFIVKKYEGTN